MAHSEVVLKIHRFGKAARSVVGEASAGQRVRSMDVNRFFLRFAFLRINHPAHLWQSS
jgi:hypothetical protein